MGKTRRWGRYTVATAWLLVLGSLAGCGSGRRPGSASPARDQGAAADGTFAPVPHQEGAGSAASADTGTPPEGPLPASANTGTPSEGPLPASARTEASTDAPPPATAAGTTPAAAGEPVDLLQSAPVELAVSSVYRDQKAQVARLFDGDLETAWNSASGDLVGAWIEIRVPPSAEVTAMALTAGFTHRTDRDDLFLGNHRVARVRVLRDGAELGTYPLDVESRELQSLPVQGPGGVYRIEVVETVPGRRRDWREVCISELQVLGRVPDARPGERWPRFDVGRLPPPRGAAPPDREALAAAHAQEIPAIERTWREFEKAASSFDSRTAPDDVQVDTEELRDWDRLRRAALERAANLVEPVDDLAADRLRRAAAVSYARRPGCDGDADRILQRRRDLDRIAEALQAVTDFVGDDEARCRWALAHAGLRILALRNAADHAWYWIEYSLEFGEADDEAAAGRRQAGVERMRDTLDSVDRNWGRRPAGQVERLQRLDRSLLPEWAPEFDALAAQIDRARAACGWTSANDNGGPGTAPDEARANAP